MTTSTNPSREIDGKGRTVRELLANRKYSIDYYQREYKWQPKQVAELLEDLVDKFLESYQPGDERGAVAGYSHYFLGSIIVSDKNGRKFIIDGQQRLTTLTLLLIHLRHHLQDDDQKGQVAELIFSLSMGTRSFNLDVPERNACMDAVYRGQEFLLDHADESIENILARYGQIEDVFPDELRDEALPYFVDWLLENVHMVEITAYSDEDAYTIFETMNDRGLSLTPADMLKGYLLANITDPETRSRASQTWKRRMEALREIGKDEDADGIKSWLRSQHAESIRERTSGARPQDFDLIGTEFHRWVRDHEDALGLTAPASFARVIESDLVFYTMRYERLRRAGESLTEGLERVHYCAQHNFTLQYPVLLAPLRPDEDEALSLRKVRTVAAFLDILIHRRIWNWRSIDYSTMQYAMFTVMREIRGKTLDEIVPALRKRIEEDREDFAHYESFGLHKMNGPAVHRLLARMTEYVETQSGRQSRYSDYAMRGRKGYDIEHIWAGRPERHRAEYPDERDFLGDRDLLGCLVLLPSSINRSIGDLTYARKLKHYRGQNLLAASLHEDTYEHNPGFRRFIQSSALPFRPHAEFKRADLEERQKLYLKLAEQIWNPGRIEEEAER